MWRRYGEYLTQLKGEAYRDQVFGYIEQEDTPRPVVVATALAERSGLHDGGDSAQEQRVCGVWGNSVGANQCVRPWPTQRSVPTAINMQAMLLNHITNLANDQSPLTLTDLPEPVPGDGEILIKVAACGVCHTELDEIEGRLPPPQLPIVCRPGLLPNRGRFRHNARAKRCVDRSRLIPSSVCYSTR